MNEFRSQIADAKININWVSKMGRGGTLLDLGANIGEVALRSKDQFDKIICVEANPKTAEIAASRLRGIDHIIVLNLAVTSDGEPPTYWVSNPSLASVGATARRRKRLRNPRPDYYFEVTTVPLSALLLEYRPRCLKIDVEDLEYELLREDQTLTYELLEAVEFAVIEFRTNPSNKGKVPLIVDRLKARGLLLAHDADLAPAREIATLFFKRGDVVHLPSMKGPAALIGSE